MFLTFAGSRDAQENLQMAFIVSDGLLSSRGAQLARMVSEAAEKNVMVVFVLIDNQGEGAGSVLDIQSIVQHKVFGGKLVLSSVFF